MKLRSVILPIIVINVAMFALQIFLGTPAFIDMHYQRTEKKKIKSGRKQKDKE